LNRIKIDQRSIYSVGKLGQKNIKNKNESKQSENEVQCEKEVNCHRSRDRKRCKQEIICKENVTIAHRSNQSACTKTDSQNRKEGFWIVGLLVAFSKQLIKNK
jgi:hypothetical protein